MSQLEVLPGDVMAGENPAKVAAARARFSLEVVDQPADFDRGYRLLDAQFGPVNEIERLEVLERWFTAGTLSPPDAPVRARYHMLLALDEDGRIAAVRDCFTALDARGPRVVVLMSHSLVLPEWRRTGVAALLRASPVGFARIHAEAAGVSGADVILVTEQEHLDPRDPDTLVRLVAYVRAGFAILPPWLVPYAQPDFRDVEALGIDAVPLPFMLLVRRVGREGSRTMAWDEVEAVLDGLYAIHSPSVAQRQLAPIRSNTLRYRDPSPGATVPLYTPTLDDPAQLAPLLGAELVGRYPTAWTAHRPPSDPADARRALEALLSRRPDP